MKHCSIFENIPGTGTVFHGKITGINCSTTEQQLEGISASVSISTFELTFTNTYEFLPLGECKTGIKPEKTTFNAFDFTWYPCEDLHHSDEISVFRMLEFIFLLCFLHPDPSSVIF